MVAIKLKKDTKNMLILKEFLNVQKRECGRKSTSKTTFMTCFKVLAKWIFDGFISEFVLFLHISLTSTNYFKSKILE